MKRIYLLSTLFLLLVGLSCKSNPNETQSAAPHKVPPATAPAAKAYTDTSITHFWFETDQDDPPGRREWVKNADRWEEHYQDGHVTKFRIEKMVKEGPYERPQLQRMADDKFDDQ